MVRSNEIFLAHTAFRNGHAGESEKIAAHEHIHMATDDDTFRNIIDEVAKGVLDLAAQQIIGNEINKKITNLTSTWWEVRELMTGTINLVNTVISHADSGSAIDTIVFLDKSARNGAYLFSYTWGELLMCGKIDKNIKKPQVRFVNIGKYEDKTLESHASLALLQHSFLRDDFTQSRVLVVDDWAHTGKSIRSAMRVLKDVFNCESTGVSQFQTEAKWWEDDMGIAGVRDVGYRSQEFKFLRGVNAADILKLKSLIMMIGKEKFNELYLSRLHIIQSKRDLSHVDLATNFEGSTFNLQVLDELIKNSEGMLAENSSLGILNFIYSAGGFLSRPLGSAELNRNAILYRKVLGIIVRSTIKHGIE